MIIKTIFLFIPTVKEELKDLLGEIGSKFNILLHIRDKNKMDKYLTYNNHLLNY